MSENHELEKQVYAALEVEPRVNLHRNPLTLRAEGDVVTLEGTVENIAAKRRAVIVAAGVPGVREVIDQLLVAPASRMGVDEILQHVRDAFIEEPALDNYRIVSVNKKDEQEIDRDPAEAAGEIIVSVEAPGRVILGGRVNSLSHRRLAGVLAWWVAGSMDVANHLEVVPPEEENDGEILDAVELVLEKDHAVDTGDMTLGCKDAVVTLSGGIPTGRQKFLAECDAWYVEGVRDVVNELVPVDPA